MKKLFKILGIILVILVIAYIVFISEECIRLMNDSNAEPLIVFKMEDDTVNNKKTYYSLGFNLNKDYLIEEKSSDDLVFIRYVGEEFYLFNRFMIWAWIE